MKDSRFSVKIVDKQPKLSVEWKPPESMFLGEIQALELVLSNVGNAPLTSLHLAHFWPGMFSFETVTKKTLFDFPLVQGNIFLEKSGKTQSVKITVNTNVTSISRFF